MLMSRMLSAVGRLTYPQVVLQDKPVAFWQLNETSGTVAYDSSGNGYNGTYEGTYTLAGGTLNAQLGKVVTLPGSNNSYVSVPASLSNLANTGPFTFEAWVNPESLSQLGGSGSLYGATLFSSDNSGTTDGWCFSLSNQYQFWLWPAGNEDIHSGSPVTVNSLYHVVMTANGATFNIYINGTLVNSSTTAACQGNATFAQIGGQGWVNGAFNGAIGQVAIYDTILSASRIQAHYNAGIA